MREYINILAFCQGMVHQMVRNTAAFNYESNCGQGSLAVGCTVGYASKGISTYKMFEVQRTAKALQRLFIHAFIRACKSKRGRINSFEFILPPKNVTKNRL